jgi:hypothetical protein
MNNKCQESGAMTGPLTFILPAFRFVAKSLRTKRKFWSFSEAARENGASRILCGIHFSSAVNAGYIQGGRVGEWVFENALRPAKPQPAITASPAVGKAER